MATFSGTRPHIIHHLPRSFVSCWIELPYPAHFLTPHHQIPRSAPVIAFSQPTDSSFYFFTEGEAMGSSKTLGRFTAVSLQTLNGNSSNTY